MRRLILIALVLLNVNSFSQIQFSANFSTLTLNGYTATNGSGVYTTAPSGFITINDSHNNSTGTFASPNTPFNYSALKTQGWLVGYNAIVNDTFLVSSSWLDTTSVTSDDWIITPTINISLANTVLRWSAMSPDANFRDGYEVYTTTVTGTPSKTDFPLGNRIFTLADNNTSGGGENPQWTNRSVLLDAFVGQTFRFAFRNNSKDRFQLWIDNIQVATVNNTRDVRIDKVEVKKYNLTNVPDSVHVTFTNMGSNTITALTLNYTYGTSGTITNTFTTAMGWGNTSVNRVTFPQTFYFTSPGIYSVNAWVSSINGQAPQNTSDDALSVNVTAINTNVPRTVLMEQFVSAYDGDSPDAQEKAQALNSPSLIVVNVHDNDTMEIVDAVSLFSDYKKNNSTALFDRYYFSSINKVAVAKNTYDSSKARRIRAVSPASVSIVNKNYNPTTRDLIFSVKVDLVGEVKGDYRINAYLTENHVCGNPTDTSVNGYNQLNNYYVVPWSPYYLKGYFSNTYNTHVLNAWYFHHQNVLIKAFDGMYGLPGAIPTTGGTTGNSYTQTFTVTIPTATNNVHKFNPDNIYIVGFVTEFGISVNERTVLNAVKEKLTANPEMIGVEENVFENVSFSIFPNPSNGELYIALSEKQLNKNLLVSIKDMLGRTVHSKKLYSTMRVNELNLMGLPNGAYIVEIEQNGHKSNQKLIIQH